MYKITNQSELKVNTWTQRENANHAWFYFCIWLVERMARVFCIKQGAKWSKINAVSRHPVEDCLKWFKRGSLTLSGKLKYAPLAKSRWTISSCPCLADQLNAEFPSCFRISERTIITLKYLLTAHPSYPIYLRKKFWGMLKKEWIDSVVFKILLLPDP